MSADPLPVPADPDARANLELLRDSWMLALRADHKSGKTLRTYREAADQFISFLTDPPPLAPEISRVLDTAGSVSTAKDVKAPHIRAFIAHVLATRRESTANNRYRGLQQWFRWMASEDEIEYSPFGKLSPPTVPERPVPHVPVEQIRAILATCKQRNFANMRDEAIIRLFCDTGIRLAEMAGLMSTRQEDQLVPHIDLQQQMVWVLGKGRRYRGVTFGSKTALAVDRYLRERRKHRQAWRPQLWLAIGDRGPLTNWGIEQMVERR